MRLLCLVLLLAMVAGCGDKIQKNDETGELYKTRYKIEIYSRGKLYKTVIAKDWQHWSEHSIGYSNSDDGIESRIILHEDTVIVHKIKELINPEN